MWLRKSSPLPPAREGQEDFWVMVHVTYAPPRFVDDDEQPSFIAGYYRNFGIRSSPMALQSTVEGLVRDGQIDWAGTEWYTVDLGSLNRSIRRQIQYEEGNPVWYASGHVFYSPEPEDEPDPY